MKYISIDIETTGLDPEFCNVLSIGAIIEDSTNPLPYEECPKFHAAILRHELNGSPRAITMNAKLIADIGAYMEPATPTSREELEKETGMIFLNPEEVVEAFYHFLYLNGMVPVDLNINLMEAVHKTNRDGKSVPVLTSRMKPVTITCAGKNFSTFDKLFLERLPRWKQAIRIKQRVLDPAIMFVDWKQDTEVPNLNKCKERAGIKGLVTHNALEDAWDVIEVLRTKY
jgi:DNA polymerase III epsilon subunit-like protein